MPRVSITFGAPPRGWPARSLLQILLEARMDYIFVACPVNSTTRISHCRPLLICVKSATEDSTQRPSKLIPHAPDAHAIPLHQKRVFPVVEIVPTIILATIASGVKYARLEKKHPLVPTPPLVLPAILVSTKTSPATPLVLNAPRDTSKTKTGNLFVCRAFPGKSVMPTEQPAQHVCQECTKTTKPKRRAKIAVPANT